MKSFVAVVALGGAVLAQSSSGTASSTGSANSTSTSTPKTSNPLIPSGASANCQAFLAEFNSNSEIKSCLKPLNNVLKAFVPTAGTSSSEKEVTDALTALCKTQACSVTTVVDILNDFGSACEKELDPDSGIKTIRDTYDVFYGLTPWKQSICAVDTGSKTPCMLEIVQGIEPSTGSSDANATLTDATETSEQGTGKQSKGFDISNYAGDAMNSQSLYLQVQGSGVSAYVPNTKTISDSNMLYMFLNPKMPTKMLCTQCTKTAMLQWLQFQTAVPYVSGLANSQLLGGQTDLWEGLEGACGSGFVNAIQQAASEGSNIPSSVAKLVISSKNLLISMAVVGAGFFFM